MNGIIAHFRGSRRRKKGNHMVVLIPGVDSREKSQGMVGKTVTWTSKAKEPKNIVGKVCAAHGNSGAVRVIFEKGMPGQSIGQEVKVE